jgi:hypothetical protein
MLTVCEQKNDEPQPNIWGFHVSGFELDDAVLVPSVRGKKSRK